MRSSLNPCRSRPHGVGSRTGQPRESNPKRKSHCRPRMRPAPPHHPHLPRVEVLVVGKRWDLNPPVRARNLAPSRRRDLGTSMGFMIPRGAGTRPGKPHALFFSWSAVSGLSSERNPGGPRASAALVPAALPPTHESVLPRSSRRRLPLPAANGLAIQTWGRRRRQIYGHSGRQAAATAPTLPRTPVVTFYPPTGASTFLVWGRVA